MCDNCKEPSVITWLNVGQFCRSCFEQLYIQENNDYRLTEDWKVLDEKRTMKVQESRSKSSPRSNRQSSSW